MLILFGLTSTTFIYFPAKEVVFQPAHALLPQGIKIRIPKYDCNSTMTMNRTASQLATAIIRPSMTRASQEFRSKQSE